MITGLDHVALGVSDFDSALRDYEALLAREPLLSNSGIRRARFQLANMAVEIFARDADDAEGIRYIAFAVSDLETALRRVERRGLKVAASPAPTWHTRPMTFLEPASTAQIPIALTEADPAGADKIGGGVSALDHVVVQTDDPDRALALYGARLGLDLRLDRSNEQWRSRLLFFRCGDLVIEIAAPLTEKSAPGPDRFGGLAWRVRDPASVRARLVSEGFDVSELRKGRKPGTRVFTVRSRTASVPTLLLESGQGDG